MNKKLKQAYESLLQESKSYLCTPMHGQTYMTIGKNCIGYGCSHKHLCHAIYLVEEAKQ